MIIENISVDSNSRKGFGFEYENFNCDVCQKISTKYIYLDIRFEDLYICKSCLNFFIKEIDKSILQGIK